MCLLNLHEKVFKINEILAIYCENKYFIIKQGDFDACPSEDFSDIYMYCLLRKY